MLEIYTSTNLKKCPEFNISCTSIIYQCLIVLHVCHGRPCNYWMFWVLLVSDSMG